MIILGLRAGQAKVILLGFALLVLRLDKLP
jgi:hypothetical protein